MRTKDSHVKVFFYTFPACLLDDLVVVLASIKDVFEAHGTVVLVKIILKQAVLRIVIDLFHHVVLFMFSLNRNFAQDSQMALLRVDRVVEFVMKSSDELGCIFKAFEFQNYDIRVLTCSLQNPDVLDDVALWRNKLTKFYG